VRSLNRKDVGANSILVLLLVLAFFVTFAIVVPLQKGSNIIFGYQQNADHGSIWLPTVVIETPPSTASPKASPTIPPTAPPTDSSTASTTAKSIETTTTATKTKDYTKTKFWRYDEAAPEIQKSAVHFLSSLTDDFRLTLDHEVVDRSVKEALDLYKSNKNNTYPHKHHLAEYNPSIAKLPDKYLTNPEWLQAFGGNKPVYIATYRISNWFDCLTKGYKSEVIFNSNYAAWYSDKPKTEFIGFALLNNELEILADVNYDFREGGLFNKFYEDYRLFNLRGGDGDTEELYLSCAIATVPIELTLRNNDKPPVPNYVKMQPPDMFASHQQQQQNQHPPFQVWHRKQYTCNNRVGKNFLYFDEKMPTSSNNTTQFETKLLVFPKGNPNEVIPMFLEAGRRCNFSDYRPAYMKDTIPYPEASFQTMEEELYPTFSNKKYFSGDRGSACCLRAPTDQIPIPASMAEHVANVTTQKNDELMIALVHYVTNSKGPKEVTERIYLSRFIAFLPHAPYTIVARTGGFCLEHLTAEEDTWNHPKYHDHLIQQHILTFGKIPIDSCSRIHFVTSMIEKVTFSNSTKDGEEMIIISYGDNDCFSRFVEIKKADIISMFRGKNYIIQ